MGPASRLSVSERDHRDADCNMDDREWVNDTSSDSNAYTYSDACSCADSERHSTESHR